MTSCRTAMVLWVCAAAWTVQAQQWPAGTILTEGRATVDAAPDYVEFWLHRDSEGADLAAAVEDASGFGARVNDWLKAETVTPTVATLSEVAVADANLPLARVSVYLRFPASPFRRAEDGLAEFTTLCGQMTALARAVEAALEGPIFGVEASEAMEESAIARSLEQALPHAAAAARVMQARVDRVLDVEVLEVAWNQDTASRSPQPEIRRVTCTARVRVRYGFAPAAQP